MLYLSQQLSPAGRHFEAKYLTQETVNQAAIGF